MEIASSLFILIIISEYEVVESVKLGVKGKNFSLCYHEITIPWYQGVWRRQKRSFTNLVSTFLTA